ncbi:MAG: UDP-N-acetylmuramoyl-tripeptide--D-alanyl-D-alanine ligase [Chthoniobacteraceae bacterium]
MDPTNLSTIAKWAGGELLHGDPALLVTHICTDSRALKAGDLFLALRGENFDGHEFVEKAAILGAAGVIVEKMAEGLPENFAMIKVGNTLDALQQIAANYRKSLPLKAVVITGSNGKTSTKDFASAVLGERFQVIKTEGNFNNHIGLPLTILRAQASDDIGVFEIGMNHPGEIAPLAKIARPDVGIITNVGVAHIEFMGSRDAIAQEKGMLAEALPKGGTLVMDANDAYTASISERTKARTMLCGIDEGEVRATGIRLDGMGSHFQLSAGGETVQAQIAVPGEHMVRNALLAIAAGIIFGLTPAECAAGLANVHLTKGRLEQKNIRGILVIDDTYNANPDSMVAALRTLVQMPAGGRRIAVLGRMGELGVESERGHRRVGEAAGALRIDCLITVGDEARFISGSAQQHGVSEVMHVSSTDEATVALRNLARAGDLVLVKGSRSAKMEKIVEGLATV